MKYRGYEAFVAFDVEERVFHGRLACTQDVVSFEACSADELQGAFHEAVDDYLHQCAASGQPPDKALKQACGAVGTDPTLRRVYFPRERTRPPWP